MKCSSCEASCESERMPTGWKKLEEAIFCPACWKARYVIKAVTIPVVSPVGMGWPELRKLLREQFDLTTKAANWAMRQVAALDTTLGVGQKMGKMGIPEPNGKSLYKGIADQFSVSTHTAVEISNAVLSKYRTARLDMHRGRASLPSIRYPHPIPVPGKTWSIEEGKDGGLVLNTPLGRKNRVNLRLKGGSEYRRQLLDIRKILDGTAVKGQLAIYENGSKLLVKIAGWFPKVVRTNKPWAASLVTGGDCLFTLYSDEQKTIYRWNADHVKRWVAAQDEQMQRLREDLKAEKRLGREKDGILARMALLSAKHTDRMHSFCHEASAQVIGHLVRRRCGTLVCSFSDTGFIPHFPWFKLKTMLANKANKEGIEFSSNDLTVDPAGQLELETQK